MNEMPGLEKTLEQTIDRFSISNSNLQQRATEIHDSRNQPESAEAKQTLRNIAQALTKVITVFNQNEDSDDFGASAYVDLHTEDSGLTDNQKTVLTEALNGVQKAWITFADTVATVFGVKTENLASD